MECRIKNREELIAGYLSGQLSEKDAEIFEEHYFRCDTCFRDLRLAEDAVNLISHGEKVTKKTGGNILKFFLHTPLFISWGITAFAAAIVIFLAVIICNGGIDSKKLPSEGKETPQTKNIAGLNGPAFRLSGYLEEGMKKMSVPIIS